MFFGLAIVVAFLVGWYVERANEKDRRMTDQHDEDAMKRTLILHTRQDVKLIAFLLFAILVMLGIIADPLAKA